LTQLWYCGSHGFDIAGPEGQQHQHPEAVRYLPHLDVLEQDLQARLAGISGCVVERKRFAIAVHYRQVDDTHLDQVCAQVRESSAVHPDLRLSTGKQIFEFQPDLDWHKGRAVRWLMETLVLDPARVNPLYMGDDVTDE